MDYAAIFVMVMFNITISNAMGTSQEVPEWNNLVYGYSSHRCHLIPDTFNLCKNIGYNKMILPNFLQHETIAEAVSSSKDWQKLTEFNCHNDTRRFLCSLYAPVCVPNEAIRKIQPCRELCLSVKKSCSPSMLTFGYKWPDILHCDKFPQKNAGLCIRGTEGNAPLDVAKRINQSMDQSPRDCSCQSFFNSTIINDKYCTSRIVLKAKIGKIVPLSNSKVALRLHKKSKIIKVRDVDMAFLSLVEIPCNCAQINTLNVREGRWLLMGEIKERQFVLNSLTKWRKKKKNFKQTIRRLRKFEQQICGNRYQASQKQFTGLNIFGQKMKEKKNRRMSRKMD